MTGKKLPKTDSIQELAEFWDAHDLTEFEDELEEVDEPVFERETVVSIHLSPEEAETIEGIAKSKGIDSVALIRQWVLQRAQSPS